MLSKEQIKKKIEYIKSYTKAINSATASQVDSNANVNNKNIATLAGELWKAETVQTKRNMVTENIKEMYGEELADEYLRQIKEHEIYVHDESGLSPYCASVSLFPFLLKGTKALGGELVAPKHFESFNGSFINLVFALSSQFSGAIATVEWLFLMDFYARKKFGDNYLETNKEEIRTAFKQVVYSLNQPASARSYQCVTEDTQLWTPEGFKYLKDLKEGDECYAWKDGKYVKTKINKLNVHQYDGNLIQFKGKHIQQTVTPNHRVLYKIPNTNTYKLKQAKDLVGHSKLSIPISADNEFEEFPITDSQLKLCTMALTDGSFGCNDKGPTALTYYMSPNRKGHKEVIKLLDELGISYSNTPATSNNYGEVNNIHITKVDSMLITRLLMHTKKEIPFFFKLLSKRQANIVLEYWAMTDGHKERDGSHLLQCDNIDIANTLQEVALLAGYGAEICTKKCNKISTPYESSETIYVKTFVRECKRVSEYNEVYYKGIVWCPTTDEGVVVFKESNNIPYISGNSVFWNISIFDRDYFNELLGHYVFPEELQPKAGDRKYTKLETLYHSFLKLIGKYKEEPVRYLKPDYDSLDKLQRYFMKWFNKERERAVLTFPVVTASFLTKDGKPKNPEFAEFLAKELSEGNSFFIYSSDNASALSSCCRLLNQYEDNQFSYSLGAGGIATGSMNVITINANHLIQKNPDNYLEALKEQVEKIHKYQMATKKWFDYLLESDMLPAYSSGYITMKKQFLTIGINGLVEGAEFLNIVPNNNEKYKQFIGDFLKVIYDSNKGARGIYGQRFNTEFVPAENLGVKNYKWDKKAGLKVTDERECYNSYFYRVEDDEISIPDKFILHGKDNLQYLDGGSALHLNLGEYPTKEGYLKLIDLGGRTGCSYWTTNVLVTCCEDCGYINKNTTNHCTKCGSNNITYATRIIGYLKKISSFSATRQNEAGIRFYHKNK